MELTCIKKVCCCCSLKTFLLQFSLPLVPVMEEEGEVQVVRTSELPFEQLPNLPPAVIPQIDLGISRVNVMALM